MSSKIKIQIKSVFGKVLFEYEKEYNTIKDTVEEAIKQKAGLRWADLSSANLSSADLRWADLRWASLSSADLSSANLSSADLRWADLRWADLRWADLSSADLRWADLRWADLSSAKEIPFVPFSCPSDGAFIGWKKVKNKLVKLLIPEDARRQSSTGWKCRCDKVKVLAITDLDESNPINEITSTEYAQCTYKVGEMAYPDSFDDNRWEECSHGIHFFINKQQAIDY